MSWKTGMPRRSGATHGSLAHSLCWPVEEIRGLVLHADFCANALGQFGRSFLAFRLKPLYVHCGAQLAFLAFCCHNSQAARLDRDSQGEKNPSAEPPAGSIRRTERFEKRGLQDLPTIPPRFGCDGRCRIWGSPSFRILCVSWLLALIFRNE